MAAAGGPRRRRDPGRGPTQGRVSAGLGERIVAAGERHPTAAYNVAWAKPRSGDRDGAIAWLGNAIDLGFRDIGLLDGDPDLAPVRSDPRFAMVRNRVPT